MDADDGRGIVSVMLADDLYILTDKARVSGWKEFRVTRGIERCPSDFVLRMSTVGNEAAVPMTPLDQCTVQLRDNVVITGWIDQHQIELTAGSHDATVSGRSNVRDLVDCSAKISGGQMTGGRVRDIAERLCKPFGVNVVMSTSSEGPKIDDFIANLGETPWQIIERFARYCGFLIFDDVMGNLVISDVGNSVMASGIRQGVNVKAAAAAYSSNERYSEYRVVWQAINRLENNVGSPNEHGFAVDAEMQSRGIYRPLIIVSEQTVDGVDLAQRRAQWEANRRWGRSHAVRVTVDSWRDSSGMLWKPNAMVDVHIPAVNVLNKRWIISEVSYNKSIQSGTTADLVLMPREAFDVLPVPIYRGNADVHNGIRT